MAESKKGFLLYSDLIHTVDKMPDEKAGMLLKHILSYVNDLNPVTDDLIVQLTFEPIKQQLKRDLEKWDQIREKRSKAGKKSAEVRKNKKEQVLTSVQQNEQVLNCVEQSLTNSTVNDNDNVNVINKGGDKSPSQTIDERKNNFQKLIADSNVVISSNEKIKFYEYWTEHGVNDRKMRFEKQKSFSVERRLKTWVDNAKKFNNFEPNKIETAQNAGLGAIKMLRNEAEANKIQSQNQNELPL